MNAWYSRVDKPHRPDFVLFDLDPPDDDGFADTVRVAHLIRRALAELGLEGYAKTSGAGGMHVLVPITRRSSFEQTYGFAEALARSLEQQHDGLVTTEWLKRKRRGVLVDHRQNAWGKTIASVYSVRPQAGAPVSTPLRWEEVNEELDYRKLTMEAALERVQRHGDLLAPVLENPQPLAPAFQVLVGSA
jgi:bifunctional non-homologous end joining protein LigD